MWYNAITTNPNSEFLWGTKMNKYYEIDTKRKGNCKYIGRVESENDNIVDSFVAMIAAIITVLSSEGFRTALRVISTVVCFVGFVGIIGGVEAGTLAVGRGVIFSMLLILIEIVCFMPKKSSD